MTEPTIHSVPLSKLYVLEPCMFDKTVKRVWAHRTFEREINNGLFKPNEKKENYHEQGCLKGLFYLPEDEDKVIKLLKQSELVEVVNPTWKELLVIYHERNSAI